MDTIGEKGRSRWIQAMVAGELAVVLAVVAPPSSGASVAMDGLEPTWQAEASPYEGTPAEHFGEGEAGIVLPPAVAVPDGYLVDATTTRDVTAEEVAEALGDVRRALIATRLDRRTLVDHDPDPFLWTLARGAGWQTWFDPHVPWMPGHEFYRSSAYAHLATLLTPSARLVAEPRVAGRVTYGEATTNRGAPATPWRILRVMTRFVWVYAFEVGPASHRIVVIRNEVTWEFPTDYRLDCCEANLGLDYTEAHAHAWGVDCDAYEEDGLIRLGDPGGAELIDSIFDLDLSPAQDDGCEPSEKVW